MRKIFVVGKNVHIRYIISSNIIANIILNETINFSTGILNAGCEYNTLFN